MKRLMISIFSICLFCTSSVIFANKGYDVIIIGTGVAGLTAAEKLSQQNKNILMLEAKNRVGGRVNSNYSWGFAVDLGASWVHGVENNPLNRLIGKHPLVANTYSDTAPVAMLSNFSLYDKQGNAVSDEVQRHFYNITKAFIDYCDSQDIKQNYQQSYDSYVKQYKLSETDKALLYYALENIYTYEFADNLNHLSPNIESAYKLSQSKGANALLPDGYFKLFEGFAAKVPKKFKQIVKTINYQKDGVEIITQDNHYHADKIIITVPLGVLKARKIKFIPELPKKKLTAIDGLGMGNYEKIFLLFEDVFWDKDKEWIGKLPQHKSQGFNVFNYYKYTNKPVLIAFTSGHLAREMETKGKLKDWVMQRLRIIYGKDIPEPIKVIQTHWGSDPYTLGSYSYLPASKDASLYLDMAEPVANKLFFAGEATSRTNPSTVHGAYLSGLRVAKEIL